MKNHETKALVENYIAESICKSINTFYSLVEILIRSLSSVKFWTYESTRCVVSRELASKRLWKMHMPRYMPSPKDGSQLSFYQVEHSPFQRILSRTSCQAQRCSLQNGKVDKWLSESHLPTGIPFVKRATVWRDPALVEKHKCPPMAVLCSGSI